jgi:anion-transporting  ArsA/GET3 family ATPase
VTTTKTTTPTLQELILTRRILVCCGAGGVGKTTAATALALAAARRGRKVLALTIDPSKRLAETLGVERNLKTPVSMPEDRLVQAGIGPPGGLETWMLDPSLIAERVVKRFAKTPERAEQLMKNRIYQELNRMVAGMQEYTAMEALHSFIQQGRYDLIILDTPPSRNALDFLDGPRRLQRFFDGRIFQLFTPSESVGFIRRAAAELVGKAMSGVFGEDNYRELQEFFDVFSDLFALLTHNAGDMRGLLSDPKQVGFLLVTSTTPESIADAMFFQEKTREMELPFRGFLLNRSQALQAGRAMPEVDLLTDAGDEVQRSALEKFGRLARLEQAAMQRDQALLADLDVRCGEGAKAVALPLLPGGASTLPQLLMISDTLMAS